MFPLEFRGDVKRQETRVMGLLYGEGCVILTSTVFDLPVFTRVTDGRMDGRAIAYSAIAYMLSRGKKTFRNDPKHAFNTEKRLKRNLHIKLIFTVYTNIVKIVRFRRGRKFVVLVVGGRAAS